MPSDFDGRVNVVALRMLLTPLIEAKVNSIGVLGSTGLYPCTLACHPIVVAAETSALD
jgi:dihydrodipicolinate synthase/N-acetylneuraminate lyase